HRVVEVRGAHLFFDADGSDGAQVVGHVRATPCSAQSQFSGGSGITKPSMAPPNPAAVSDAGDVEGAPVRRRIPARRSRIALAWSSGSFGRTSRTTHAR